MRNNKKCNPYDNACTESFFATLKNGLVRLLYSHNDKVVCIQKEDKNGK